MTGHPYSLPIESVNVLALATGPFLTLIAPHIVFLLGFIRL
jgi:hypothetical protein